MAKYIELYIELLLQYSKFKHCSNQIKNRQAYILYIIYCIHIIIYVYVYAYDTKLFLRNVKSFHPERDEKRPRKERENRSEM